MIEQSESPLCERLVDQHAGSDYIHTPDERGLSRARNRALSEGIRGDWILFPDDDCLYPEGFWRDLRGVLDGATADAYSVRQLTPSGEASMLRWSDSSMIVGVRDVPRTINSSTLILSSKFVRSVGYFDERLGVGAQTVFQAGEENDFVVRGIKAGLVCRYLPDLHVIQEDWRRTLSPPEVRIKARRYNTGFGAVLRKHRLVGQWFFWVARSVVGCATGVATLRPELARLQWAQLAGRVEGFLLWETGR